MLGDRPTTTESAPVYPEDGPWNIVLQLRRTARRVSHVGMWRGSGINLSKDPHIEGAEHLTLTLNSLFRLGGYLPRSGRLGREAASWVAR